ncbi:MAG TPA: phosphoribosyl-ATP diphosphatase [Oscillospiraceae bacterium]|nr:phosphoribosyl-ATP diphosphatase [Oscillospiraceae bacterium]
MHETIAALYEVILERKKNPAEGSYTCYLFSQGLDKILKKVGEECSETIIAAKNGDNAATTEELCDLVYHLLVLMAEEGITPDAVQKVLEARREKIGNLKAMRVTDRET